MSGHFSINTDTPDSDNNQMRRGGRRASRPLLAPLDTLVCREMPIVPGVELSPGSPGSPDSLATAPVGVGNYGEEDLLFRDAITPVPSSNPSGAVAGVGRVHTTRSSPATSQRTLLLLSPTPEDASGQSLLSAVLRFILKIVLIIVPRPQPGIWTMDNSMHPFTLSFRDEKIERGYQWHANKRYLRSNRRFSWFIFTLSAFLIFYHWLVESRSRFLYYLPCNMLMIVPMVACVVMTYVRSRDRFFVYKYSHVFMSVALFVSSCAWMLGQPLVLLVLDDPLVLDPMHTLFVFFIFNLVVANLYYAILSTTTLISLQCLVCCIGLRINDRPFSQIFSYLVNDFLSLVLAYIFAYLCGRVKELYMRQIYMVLHFQKEEASILSSSRLKMDILNEGMKALKNQHPEISPPSSPVIRKTKRHAEPQFPTNFQFLRHSSSEPNLPQYPPRVLLAAASDHVDSSDPQNYMSIDITEQQTTPLVRLMKSSRQLMDTKSPGSLFSPRSNKDDFDDLETGERFEATAPIIQFSADPNAPVSEDDRHMKGITSNDLFSAETEDDHNILMEMLTELPHWLIALPQALKSRSTRKTLRKRISQYFKYRICMYAGERKMEEGFLLYWSPLAICRVRMLFLSAVIGGVTITLLNYFIHNYTAFEVIIRLCYMPTVALTAYFLVSTKKVHASPRLCQTIILTAVYLLFVGYLMLVFDSHWQLREAYAKIDPFSKYPTLTTPSSSPDGFEDIFPWIPPSPFDASNITITDHSRNVTYNWDEIFDLINSDGDFKHLFDEIHPETPEQLFNYRKLLISEFLASEARYMIQLNALTLFCCFAASSSGLRLVTFLAWMCATIVTVSIAALYSMSLTGHDGERVRMVGVIIGVTIAGVGIARPLESEMRKWYHIKANFGL